MAVILVTGANGQLGNELRVISRNFYGYDFLFTDIDTLDITNPGATREFITANSPDWIINCAAYNFVDKAESEPDSAMAINALAVRNITDAIQGLESRLIHVSTDYVYDGRACTPYSEDSDPNPQSAYGRSKLAGERYAMMHPWSMVIRTSWLYSSFGNNFVRTMLKAGRERDSLKVVFDQTGSPTWAADLGEAIMNIVSGVIRNHFIFNAGIYNYSNEGVCTWYDFALEIMEQAGLDCTVHPVLSKDYRQQAVRPSYSVMDKSKIKDTYGLAVPHWRKSLVKCMKLLN
jgi:dTDP-4-dehydrorhamnose reductase